MGAALPGAPAAVGRPLGIREDVRLSDSQLAARARLASYDLSRVRRRLLQRGTLPEDWVDEAIFEFRRFLWLSIIGDFRLVMVSPAVDEVWHECVLLTRLYADLCAQTVGRFVHHEPVGEDQADRQEGRDGLAGFRSFTRAYTAAYGPTGRMWRLPVLFWRPRPG